jgi:hypothetical protein
MTPSENTVLPLVKPQKFDVFRIIRIRVLRLLYRNLTNTPFISGDSIAKCCDYVAYGRFENKKISARKLAKANSIFVPGHYLDHFLQNYKDHINAKTIVSGNSDTNFHDLPDLPESVSLFICQNLAVSQDPRALTLPIGIENLRLGRSGRPSFHKAQSNFEITNKILIPPMSPTNLVRRKIMIDAKSRPELFDLPDSYMSESKYFALTRKYRFIFAAEGNGFDSHRVWEILYQGSIPIVLRTPWSESLVNFSLPILYVDKFTDISKELIANFDNQSSRKNPKEIRVLWTPFWFSVIKAGLPPSTR